MCEFCLLILQKWKNRSIGTMCLIAISNDFFEMVLPNPLLSVAVAEALRDLRATASGACGTLRGSW